MAVLSPAMIDALRQLTPEDGDAPALLDVVACCLRLHEPLLLSVAVGHWVWPLTLHPTPWLYRAPLDWWAAPPAGLGSARLLACEPPPAPLADLPDRPDRPDGGRPRLLPPCHYPLGNLLWSLALLGPAQGLLPALAQHEQFRAIVPGRDSSASRLVGAMGSALARLLGAPAGYAEICRWPGMDPNRAARLLNGLYLEGRLVTEAGPLERNAGDSAWSDTVPSRWPMQGSFVRTRLRHGFPR